MTSPSSILALDATTEACSVALSTPHGTFNRFQETARGHSALLMGLVEEVLAEAGQQRGDLDLVAFCRGPGSFTGVRIAAGVAQGLALALAVRVAPVSTLACIAQRAQREYDARRVLVAVDARMGEVYWGAFEAGADGLVGAVGDEVVSAPEAVPLPPGDDWQGFGTGWRAHGEALGRRLGGCCRDTGLALLPAAEDALPLARHLAASGATVAAAQAQPVYLRDRVTA